MAVRVNGVRITEAAIQFELNRLVKFYSEHMSAEQIRAQMDVLKQRAKQQAIGAKLLIDEAARLDLRVPPVDIDAGVERMVQNAGGREAFDRMLGEQDLTEQMVRQGIEQGRRVDLLVERITDGMPEPTEADIVAHFRAHAEEYARPDRAQAQHILLRFDAESHADRETARSRLEEIRQQILEGASFADQAAAHSECPSGKQTGGSLGWLSRGMTVDAFDAVIFDMEVGELSEVIETELGYHLIQKTGHEEGGEAEFDDAREKIREFLHHAARGEAISAHVQELREKAQIEVDEE